MSLLNLKLLTLNCWGIPVGYFTQRRGERIKAICKELSKGEYDVVLLQEVWCQEDYDQLCSKLSSVMPYSHYWHSGMIGSGICIFSKHTILETFQHNYSINGYPHRIFHGDWYGGKCVGLAKIMAEDFRINIYATHTHAGYSNEKSYGDDYMAHRITQAYEMSQFIRFTSEPCDVVLVGGDFNFRPEDLGYKIIKCNANLQDAWISQKENKGHCPTSDAKTNSYTNRESTGDCIDFIMYRCNSGTMIDCEKCYCTMGKMPESDNNYSDHEGVAAELTLKRMVTAMATPRDASEIEKNFLDVVPVIDQGVKTIKATRVFNLVLFFLCLILLVFISDLYLPYGMNAVLKIMKVCLVIVAGFSIWSASVLVNKELNGLLAARKDINNLLKSNPSI